MTEQSQLRAAHSLSTAGWCPPDIIAELCDEAEDLLVDLIATFREDTLVRLRELNSAIAERDLERVRKGSHAIKGSARQLGANGVADISEMIERRSASGDHDGLPELLCRLQCVYMGECDAMADYLRDHTLN